MTLIVKNTMKNDTFLMQQALIILTSGAEKNV